jgi:hypothetical protein
MKSLFRNFIVDHEGRKVWKNKGKWTKFELEVHVADFMLEMFGWKD